jgi:hypothetical protein
MPARLDKLMSCFQIVAIDRYCVSNNTEKKF